ncbi:Winged helix-turn-helix domain-containing protein [Sulfidibacter corallicola]|uniref:Winged helix-turn-helix domain-containing protein n=1 Tax=Sulfidibacter corallicola TaxID=2818388 RepID=A0A8A4TQC7_SULCO|nr:winged helix-turn-helix domain-containing protein [Sulfidibacter corallicola]QTD52169.1 winged helix-turn-helix domain-containing protein [Sulfidibacter corallicola]
MTHELSPPGAAPEAADIDSYDFDEFHLDVTHGQLFRDGNALPLNAKYLDALIFLVQNAGRPVSRDEFFQHIWHDSFVSDAALSQCIKDIRKTLGDKPAEPRYIKTLPKRGYMFVGACRRTSSPATGEARQEAVELPRRPYKFLQSFDEEDRALFYGREREIREVTSLITHHPTFLLYGPSGVGKSSLVAAGLAPALTAKGHRVVRLRGFPDPLWEMGMALGLVDQPDSSSQILQVVASTLASKPASLLVFFFDQFEEWFHFTAPEKRERLMQVVSLLRAQPFSPRLRFFFTLREDALAHMNHLKAPFPEIFHFELRLERLDLEAGLQAVLKPAGAAGCRFEDGLAETIVADLSDESGVDLPSLQIICDRLFDARDTENRLTLERYRQLGGAAGVLSDYLQRVLRRFDGPGLGFAKAILSRLLGTDGRRAVIRETQLLEGLDAAPDLIPEKRKSVVESLAQARIVRIRLSEGESWVELVHDYLVPAVSDLFDEAEKKSRRAQQVFTRALENYRDQGLLLSRQSLTLLGPHLRVFPTDSIEHELLIRSHVNAGLALPAGLAPSPCDAPFLRERMKAQASETRIAAARAVARSNQEELRRDLARLALYDEDAGVRRQSAAALADALGPDLPRFLKSEAESGIGGWWAYLSTLALIRDENRGFLPLKRQPPPIVFALMVVLALVRLRRHKAHWGAQTAGGALGGAAAGACYGLMLGGIVRYLHLDQGLPTESLFLALASLGSVMGLASGFLIQGGTCAAAIVSHRHSRYWTLTGGLVGGASLGFLFHTVVLAIYRSLLGIGEVTVAGWFEGMMLGGGLGLGLVWCGTGDRPIRGHRIRAALMAATTTGIAAGLVNLLGGASFVLSLENLIASLTNLAQMKELLPLPKATPRIWLIILRALQGASEGALFALGCVAGSLILGTQGALEQDEGEQGNANPE